MKQIIIILSILVLNIGVLFGAKIETIKRLESVATGKKCIAKRS
jgi:hypothetical protein